VGVAAAAALNRQNGGAEAIGSRILAGFFLAIQSVVGGYIRSSSPRCTSYSGPGQSVAGLFGR
jgi:hypothetical protein